MTACGDTVTDSALSSMSTGPGTAPAGSRLRVLCVSFGRRCCPCSGGVPDSEPADCRAAVFTRILSLERRVGEGQIGQCGHKLPEGGHEGEL